jgi:hypothetical protein
MARTDMTPRKSTGGRFPTGQLAPHHLLEDVDEEPVSGIHPGYSCKEGGRVEDGLLLEFPCSPTRTRSV